MPPKKNNQKGPSAKTLQKEKAKVVEDKTFGLKNKNKSKVVQSHIRQVTTQVMDGGTKKVRIAFSHLLTSFAIGTQCLNFGCDVEETREVHAPKRRLSTPKRHRNKSRPPRRLFWPLCSRRPFNSRPMRQERVSSVL